MVSIGHKNVIYFITSEEQNAHVKIEVAGAHL
jgi:hypothetical protein